MSIRRKKEKQKKTLDELLDELAEAQAINKLTKPHSIFTLTQKDKELGMAYLGQEFIDYLDKE